MKTAMIAVFLLLSAGLHASEYKDHEDRFFELYLKGEVDQAVEFLYSSNPYVSSIPDQIMNVKNQLANLPGLVGSFQTLNLVESYRVADSIVHTTYIATFERQPVRFEFQFFRIKQGWRIFSFSYDVDLSEEIKMMARERALRAME